MPINLFNNFTRAIQANYRRVSSWFQYYREGLLAAFSSMRDHEHFRHSLQHQAGTRYRELQLREEIFQQAFRDASDKMADFMEQADKIYYDNSVRIMDIPMFSYALYRMTVSVLRLMLANGRKEVASIQFRSVSNILRNDVVDYML